VAHYNDEAALPQLRYEFGSGYVFSLPERTCERSQTAERSSSPPLIDKTMAIH
jgi:hypothetical protein